MAKPKDGKPLNGPIGNRDNSKRGRGVSGRDSKGPAQSAGSGDGKTARTKDDPDTDGYSVGGR